MALPEITINGGARKEYAYPNLTMNGTFMASSGGVVEVEINGSKYAPAISGSTWSLPLPSGLIGDYTASAKVTDALGNYAIANQQITVQSDNTGYKVNISGGASVVTNNRTPTISGTAFSKNDDFELYINGTRVYTTKFAGGATASDRTWSYTLTAAQALSDGVTNTVTARLLKNGTEAAIATQKLKYINAAPVFVTIKTPITGGSLPVINGTSTANATVEVSLNNVSYGTVSADADGAWSLPLERPLSVGTYTIIANATVASGAAATSQSVSYTVSANDVSISIDNGDAVTINDPEPTIRGRTNAPVGSTVQVVLSKPGSPARAYSALVASGGVWRIEVPIGEEPVGSPLGRWNLHGDGDSHRKYGYRYSRTTANDRYRNGRNHFKPFKWRQYSTNTTRDNRNCRSIGGNRFEHQQRKYGCNCKGERGR